MTTQLLRPHAATVALILVLQLVQALCLLAVPTLNADVIDNGCWPGTPATSSAAAASCSR